MNDNELLYTNEEQEEKICGTPFVMEITQLKEEVSSVKERLWETEAKLFDLQKKNSDLLSVNAKLQDYKESYLHFTGKEIKRNELIMNTIFRGIPVGLILGLILSICGNRFSSILNFVNSYFNPTFIGIGFLVSVCFLYYHIELYCLKRKERNKASRRTDQ